MSKSRTAHERIQTFEWTYEEEPSIQLVRALSDVVDADPFALDPLYETIDPEALTDVLYPPSAANRQPSVSVEFDYHDHRILIKENGRGYIYAT